MQSVSLLDLRTAARERANMESSQFVSDTELNRYINHSLAELYDLLIASYEDYNLSLVSFTLPSITGPNAYALPSDFYKLRGLDYQLGSDWVALRKFNFTDRHRKNHEKQYRITGDRLTITPETDASGTYQMFYVQSFQSLVNDADLTSLSFAGWDEYVVVDSAIKCLQKEESDVSALMAQKERLIQRIQAMAADRDAGEPEQVADVNCHDYLRRVF